MISITRQFKFGLLLALDELVAFHLGLSLGVVLDLSLEITILKRKVIRFDLGLVKLTLLFLLLLGCGEGLRGANIVHRILAQGVLTGDVDSDRQLINNDGISSFSLGGDGSSGPIGFSNFDFTIKWQRIILELLLDCPLRRFSISFLLHQMSDDLMTFSRRLLDFHFQ